MNTWQQRFMLNLQILLILFLITSTNFTKKGLLRDTTIEIEKSYEEGDFYAVQFHCADGSYNETRTAICFNDFKDACGWVDSHDDEHYEIVPQKFGCEFVNYWD